MSLRDLLSKGSTGQAGSLLKGSDVPAGITTIVIEVAGWRKAPEGFGAPLILDLKKPVYGKTAWAVNRTNLRMLITLFGEKEEDLVGRKIKLLVISVTNPKTGEIVPSLAVKPDQLGK
jgi:hypothetical protein